MSSLYSQIRGLYSKTDGSLFWEEGKAIFCTRHFTLLENKIKSSKRTGSEIKKLRAFKDSDCTFGARVRKTDGARSYCIPELLALKWLSENKIYLNTLCQHFQTSDSCTL